MEVILMFVKIVPTKIISDVYHTFQYPAKTKNNTNEHPGPIDIKKQKYCTNDYSYE